MFHKAWLSGAVLAVSLGVGAPAIAEDVVGDAANGATVFNACKTCHLLEAGKKSRPTGPNLHGVVDRAAGTEATYTRFSPAMKNSGITWTEDNLHAYLENPRTFIKGNRMAYAGVKDAQKRADVIEFIKAESAK